MSLQLPVRDDEQQPSTSQVMPSTSQAIPSTSQAMPSTSPAMHDTPTLSFGYKRLLKELGFEHFHDENVGDRDGEELSTIIM